ncbi:MAG: hypothetical protein WD341_08730 [Tistlia sp.]|uniref:hypothetical protein n=1 Tax=Tistlia sp. TaxID=3057121 RepID=UPI0034A21A7C
MAASKKTLGYPSRTDAVIALRRQGLTTREIAARIGIKATTVVALEHSARRSMKRTARAAEQLGRTLVLPVDVLDRLAPHARRRGVHVNSLARRIVETVVDEKMVDAVLDDADDVDRSRRSGF